MKLKYTDSSHSYFLNGTRCKSVTTVAKIPEDLFRLQQWQLRQVAIGLAMKPKILERISVALEDNNKLNALCEEAQREAGAHEGRDRGNVLHNALENFDTGRRQVETDLTSAAIGDWKHILDAMEWRVDLVERCVVWPDQKIAGRFDRIIKTAAPCATCGAGRVVGDFKGGPRVLDYPHAICCQLALYANAPLLAGPIPGEGGETEDFEPLTDVCTCRAYVINLPPDAPATLIKIDIGAALPVVKNVIFPTIQWRAAKGLAKIVELPTAEGEGDRTAGATPPTANPAPSHPEPSPFDDDPFAGLPGAAPAPVLNENPWAKVAKQYPDEPMPPNLDARHDNLRDRLNFLKASYGEMAQIVASRWPEGVPNIRMPLTGEDLDKIEAVLIDAERAVEAPFHPFVPAQVQPHTSTPTHADPEPARSIDEGPDMDPGDLDAMKAELERLEPNLYDRINEWVAQASNAGTPISLRSHASKRRFSIARFMLLAVHAHEDVVRAVLSLTLGDEIQTTITTGSVLGVLTSTEAEKAWEVMLGIEGSSPLFHVVRVNGDVKLVAA